MIRGVGAWARSWAEGRTNTATIRKVPAQASTAGMWVDLSMTPAQPKANYYASDLLVAATLDAMDGIYHQGAGARRYLAELMLTTVTAGLVGRYVLCDYLLYYPFIELDNPDAQTFTNEVALPRYADGEGVRAMLVAVAPTAGSGQFTFTYLNQDGIEQTSPVQFCDTAAVPIASIVTGRPATVAGNAPFLSLASGDTGIRAVTGLQMTVPDGGLGTLVLVRPLADHYIREINTPSEVTWVDSRAAPPVIEDGAYLNLVMQCAATVAAGLLTGRATFVWE